MNSEIKFVHTNIVSRDWEKLSSFYEKVFGCKRIYPERSLKGEWIEKGTGVKDVHIRGIHLRLPGYGDSGPTLEIFQYNIETVQKEKLINRHGFAHIAFHVNDVEGLLKKVIAEGGGQIGEIVYKDFDSIGRLAFVYAADPEGNIIELQNWKKIQK